MSAPIIVTAEAPATELRSVIEAAAQGQRVAVVAGEHTAAVHCLELMAAAIEASGAATSSPVPAGDDDPVVYERHRALPPPPSLALPCPTMCLIDLDALSSLGEARAVHGSAADQVESYAVQLLQHGWRHVAAPGVALAWDPRGAPGPEPVAAWSQSTLDDLVGPANAGLETHVTWAASRVRPVRVVVDGACLDGDLHTGTQHVVIEVSRQLQLTRTEADVSIAAPAHSIEATRELVESAGVKVVERSASIDADVMYRPYQMLRVDELDAVMSVGRRRLVGQLDMIGFSNPFYHPSPQLFGFARNLQRHMMRDCDGVTFISESGRQAALAECPDLAPARLHVVSCGADPEPAPDPVAPDPDLADGSYLLCLSATFWHKNRGHAIATFADLVESTGYDGRLVIAGPEPFYGRSTTEDDSLLAGLPAGVRDRVLRIGQVSNPEKWWLLEHAQAVVYPSVVEGFGLVPFEAARVATPCLAYEGTAPAELLRQTGATIPTWDPAAWANRLAGWIAEPDTAASVVAEVDAIASTCTWQRSAERTWDAIDATLAQPSRSMIGEDGGALSKIAAHRPSHRRGAALRFLAARAQPAVARRVRGVVGAARRAR